MTPVEPPKKAIGTNTAERTMAMPTRADWISPIDLMVAVFGSVPSSRITRSTFSTTTMASSTNRPMASTMANIVSMLMENPQTKSAPNVPRSTTGTAIVGMSVARKFCRKRYITTTTSTMASKSVLITPLRAAEMNGVVSNGITTSMPSGKLGLSSSTRSRTAFCVAMALAPEASLMAMPAAG